MVDQGSLSPVSKVGCGEQVAPEPRPMGFVILSSRLAIGFGGTTHVLIPEAGQRVVAVQPEAERVAVAGQVEAELGRTHVAHAAALEHLAAGVVRPGREDLYGDLAVCSSKGGRQIGIEEGRLWGAILGKTSFHLVARRS